MSSRILLIDDTEDIGDLIVAGLNNYLVDYVCSLQDAEQALARTKYDLLLIDVSLTDGSGFEFCLKLSQDPLLQNIPRILLTALNTPAEKVYGFSCGADDYLTKPFDMIELRARIDRYFRKSSATETSSFTCANFFFDLEFSNCFLIENESKTDLGLTPIEFRLFLSLAKSDGRVLTRKDLERAAWEPGGNNIQIRGIDTHIAHLRKKLGPMKDAIVSIYGQGYAFKKREAA